MSTQDILKGVVTGLSALAIVGTTSAIAQAQTTASSPIAVSDVRVTPNGMSGGFGPGNVSLTFENMTDAVATEVDFLLDNGVYGELRDVGTFSPGVPITHSFVNYGPGTEQVSVAEVKFANGTIWQSGEPVPGLRQASLLLNP